MKKINKKTLILFFLAPLLVAFSYFVIVKAETLVDTKKEIITLSDRDGDGIIDSEDPHPDYPEIYIVEDKNFNGIVDKFENQ